MKDPKNLAIIILIAAIAALFLFMNGETTRKSKTIRNLEKLNKDYLIKDSILNLKYEALQADRDSLKAKRDTIIIYINKANENVRKEINRIDSTHTDTLVIELTNRYE